MHTVIITLTDLPNRGGTEDVNRWTPVNHGMLINAQALINLARKRLCFKSHKETQRVMLVIASTLRVTDEALAERLVPECKYRRGCPEVKSCGYYETVKK